MDFISNHSRTRKFLSGVLSLLMIFSLAGYFPISQTADARSMSPVSYTAGKSSYSVAIGDLNNDNLDDVAVTNFGEGTVGIFYQQGGGTLGAMVTIDNPPDAYNLGSFLPNPYGLDIIDFDKDGRNDLIVTNEFQHQAWVYRQDGSGGLYLYQLMYTPPIETHPYSNPYSIDGGDLDGDTYPEIAVANYYWRDGGGSDFGSVGLFLNRNTAVQDLYSVDFTNSATGWISGYHTIYNTLTGGWNPLTGTGLWSAQYLPFDDKSTNDVNTNISGIDFVDQNFGIAVGDFGMIMRTVNGGYDWDKAGTSPVTDDLSSVSMSDRKHATAVGAGGVIARTTNGGITWDDKSDPILTVDLNDVAHLITASAESWMVGDNGVIGVYTSYDPDAILMLSPSFTTETLNSIDFVGTEGWIAGDNGTILESVTTTTTLMWQAQTSGITENLNEIDFVNVNTGWAVGVNGTILKTTDSGVNWNPQSSNTSETLNGVSFADTQNGWAVGNGGTILVTNDGGATWLDQGFSSNTAFSSMFNYPMESGGGQHPYVAKINDINNDGKNDITYAGSSGHIANMRMGMGPKGKYLFMNSNQTVAVGALPADMVFLDYNNDGRPDIATSNYLNNTITVLIQPVLPNGGFQLAETLDTGERPLGLDAGDINGDGFEDLAVANSNDNSISIFTKQGNKGPFNPQAVFNSAGEAPYGLSLGDVNNDSQKEIVIADSGPLGGNRIEVFSPTATPGAPTVVSSTHPDNTVYYSNNKPQFTISPPADIDGIDGYYWLIDTSSDTVPTAANNFSTSGNITILNGLADGSYYFHIVAKDELNNIGNTANMAAHYLFRINSTPLIATIQSPGEGTTVSGTINIDATATTSPLFNISKVEIYIDGNQIPEAILTGAPYTYSWNTNSVADGSHTIKIIAYDAGNRQASDQNSIIVNNSASGGGDGGSSSGVNQSSIELTGDQYISKTGDVTNLTYYDPATDKWNKVGYFAPGAVEGSAIYKFNLPSPNGYLWQKLTIDENTALASGEPARFYAFNWSTGNWDAVPTTGELAFWYVKPVSNEVQIRVVAPAWSVHQINDLILEFKYQSDATGPQVTSVNGSMVNYANPYFSRLSFSLSEKSFLTIDIRDSNNILVKQINTAKYEGIPAIYWDLTDNLGNPLPPDNYTFQVTATDLAGNVTVSVLGAIEYRATSITPYMAISLMNWDWSKIKSVTGDFNNDGMTDIAVMEDLGGDRSVIHQLTSTGASFTVTTVWDSGAGNWNAPATDIGAGDFNNDGADDLVAIYGYGGAQTRAFVFLSNGATLTSPIQWWDSGAGNWEKNGSKIVMGDLNGDGRDDLATLYGYSGARTRLFVSLSTGAAFNTPAIWWDSGPGNWDWVGSKLSAGDFNADGRDDIGILYGYSGARTAFWVLKSSGAGLNSPQAWWDSGSGNWDWNGSQVVIGDFNKDALDDFVILYTYGGNRTKLFASQSTGSGFLAPITVWDSGPGNWDGSQSRPLGGDYNGDGIDDVSVLYNYGVVTGVWVMNL